MVLFVTGRCSTGCFYCPVSFEKKGMDVVYANERKVATMEEVFEEAESMDATGTGITGGDPLINMDRTLRVIKALKERYGKGHHIHLYTSTLDPEKVRQLMEAGLDEIRFHPPTTNWTSMENTALKDIAKMDIDVGLEVPALPDYGKQLTQLIGYAQSVGVSFVNLNELEFSESNWDMMEAHNYQLEDEISSAIKGSKELALEIMKSFPKMRIHLCSSSFKDGVQLRNRLIRKAEHMAKEYVVVTEDGTVLIGLIYADDLKAAVKLMKNEYDVPDELMYLDKERNRLEIAPWVVEELAGELPFKCYMSEEYPTADRLEVERTPLN